MPQVPTHRDDHHQIILTPPPTPAWSNQLADGGWLIVPLRMRGLTRSIVFEREDGNLANRAYELCDFVPMQDAGEYRSDWSSSR